MRLTTIIAYQFICTCIAFALAMPALAKQETIEKTIKVIPGGLLDLKSSTGSIEVESWNEKNVYVSVKKKAWSQAKLDTFSIDIEKTDKGVSIEGGGNNGWKSDVSVSYAIKVPKKYNLSLQTGGGSIAVEDIDGSVKVNTSGGSINVGNIVGSLNADTSGGSINVGKVTGEAKVDTSGGSINIEAGGTRVSADTSGGSITIGKSDGDVKADTSGGSIRIAYSKGNVKADTSGGSIYIEGADGHISADTSGGNIKISSAKGNVKADTSGGGISIENAEGEIHADTAGGSISVHYVNRDPKNKVSIRLETAGGDIRLSVPKNIQATVDAILERYHRSQKVNIDSDFPLNITEDNQYVKADGDINGGGGRIELRTVSSDVTIRSVD